MKELWTNKYTPQSLKEYVFGDANQKQIIEGWVKSGALPHLLLQGPPGTGKTSLAHVLLKELGVNHLDILEINASLKLGIDKVNDKIEGFCSMMPIGEFRYVLLDEADHISPFGQAALRGCIEKYSEVVRFILTCNYPHKIIPALKDSRLQCLSIEKLNKEEYAVRIADVLMKENVNFDPEILQTYIDTCYPDMRKCLGLCQSRSQSGTLLAPEEKSEQGSDYQLQMVNLFKQGRYKDARELICKQASIEEYEGIYRFMYDNINLWGKTDKEQDEAIVIIRDGLVKHVSCADAEINLSATLTQLANITRK